ncbi:MAG: hypothetical protein A2020_09585 [Lentisphaerae bacterium GWF2_45_14]|nr:MAG: hypothetical protein A2020_09585 [Lentisphaerae bacterium GWF2_45_14]
MTLSNEQDTMFARKSLEFEKKMILQKINGMTNLPTPGNSIMKVMLLLRDEDVAMRELIESIKQNQSLVARILKLVNSGYYGLRKSIDSVDRAVNLLGILKVKQLVYSASIMDMFSQDEQDEWNHAYSSSVLMSDIMEAHEIPAASNLPLTVLMHDIGKVVLRRFSPKKFQMAVASAHRENIPVFESEDSVIHINHAEVGRWLLEKWQMTEDIYIPVGWHHSIELPPEQFIVEVALVQFTNWVDCVAREIPCPPPTKELMDTAGFEEIDNEYWIDYQRGVIASIEQKEGIPVDGDEEAEAKSAATPSEGSMAPVSPTASTVSAPAPVSPSVVVPRLKSLHLEPVPVTPAEEFKKTTSTEKLSRQELMATVAVHDVIKEEAPPPAKSKTDTERINRKRIKDRHIESAASKNHTVESSTIRNIRPTASKKKGFFSTLMKVLKKFFNS